MKKRLISSCLCFMALLMIMASGCYNPIKYFKLQGDFKYCYIKGIDSRAVDDGNYVAVLELSLQGQQKETLIIPEEIDGKKVIKIGYKGGGFGGTACCLDLTDCKKVFFPKTIQKIERMSGSTDTKYIFNNSENLKILVMWFDSQTYLSRQLYDRFSAEYGNYESIKIANVEYVVDGAVYFVDDYGEGEIIEAPPEPVKEGYVFDGWYTEENYTNKWNFEENTFKLEEEQPVKSFFAKFEKIN